MIYYDVGDGSPQAVGTVFRCGTHYAMTAYHVIQFIVGRSRNANLAPLHFSFVSHQGYIITGTFDEVIKFCKISCCFYIEFGTVRVCKERNYQ